MTRSAESAHVSHGCSVVPQATSEQIAKSYDTPSKYKPILLFVNKNCQDHANRVTLVHPLSDAILL